MQCWCLHIELFYNTPLTCALFICTISVPRPSNPRFVPQLLRFFVPPPIRPSVLRTSLRSSLPGSSLICCFLLPLRRLAFSHFPYRFLTIPRSTLPALSYPNYFLSRPLSLTLSNLLSLDLFFAGLFY